MTNALEPKPIEAPQLAVRGWVVPVVGFVLQCVVGGAVVLLGVHYDGLGRTPGPLTWLGVIILASPWLGYARSQWRREQAWIEERTQARLAENKAAVMLRPIVKRHQSHISQVIRHLEAELDDDGDD